MKVPRFAEKKPGRGKKEQNMAAYKEEEIQQILLELEIKPLKYAFLCNEAGEAVIEEWVLSEDALKILNWRVKKEYGLDHAYNANVLDKDYFCKTVILDPDKRETDKPVTIRQAIAELVGNPKVWRVRLGYKNHWYNLHDLFVRRLDPRRATSLRNSYKEKRGNGQEE
jgi:hypothetical protein